jgi:predicted peptidase
MIFLALTTGCATMAQAPRQETGFLNRSITIGGAAYRYQVYVPADYDPSRQWPVILFLHGGGETGSDGLLQTQVGLGAAIRRFSERYPAIVVMPQAPAGPPNVPASVWQTASDVALGALDATLAEFATDPSRIYLTGMSQGGHGTWYLAYHHPDRFAALVAICAWVTETGGRPGVLPASGPSPFAAVADRVKHLPTWIFHGDADTVVPVEESRRMNAALQAAGANVRYTELPGGNHNAWDPAYMSAELPAWLFAQRKP